ncbi:hypothetical protein A2U01_0092783, partial [Trifolium medium]|nr:hypothetical protein [Trifolium medium]
KNFFPIGSMGHLISSLDLVRTPSRSHKKLMIKGWPIGISMDIHGCG